MMRSITRKNSYNRYRNRKYRRLKAESVERLGGKCVWCGSTKSLEFDHVDRNTRKHRFPQFVFLGKERFEVELAKCQLLCSPCHRKKTLTERGLRYGKGIHGNINNYQHHGCRCDKCRMANTIFVAQRRAIKRTALTQV